jgi:hypothetical protein
MSVNWDSFMTIFEVCLGIIKLPFKLLFLLTFFTLFIIIYTFVAVIVKIIQFLTIDKV